MHFHGKLHTLRSKFLQQFTSLCCGVFSPSESRGLHMYDLPSEELFFIISLTLDIPSLTAHCLQLRNSMGYSGFRALSWSINMVKKSPEGQCGINSNSEMFSLCFIISRWPDSALLERQIWHWHNSEAVQFLWPDDKVGMIPMSSWQNGFKDGHKRHKPRVIY